jgi:hypothetical protein
VGESPVRRPSGEQRWPSWRRQRKCQLERMAAASHRRGHACSLSEFGSGIMRLAPEQGGGHGCGRGGAAAKKIKMLSSDLQQAAHGLDEQKRRRLSAWGPCTFVDGLIGSWSMSVCLSAVLKPSPSPAPVSTTLPSVGPRAEHPDTNDSFFCCHHFAVAILLVTLAAHFITRLRPNSAAAYTVVGL